MLKRTGSLEDLSLIVRRGNSEGYMPSDKGSTHRANLSTLPCSSHSEVTILRDLLPLDLRCLLCLASAGKHSIDREIPSITIYLFSSNPTVTEDAPFVEYSIGSCNKVQLASLTHLVLNLPDVQGLVFVDREKKSAKLKFIPTGLLILLAVVPDIRRLQLNEREVGNISASLEPHAWNVTIQGGGSQDRRMMQ